MDRENCVISVCLKDNVVTITGKRLSAHLQCPLDFTASENNTSNWHSVVLSARLPDRFLFIFGSIVGRFGS